MTDTTEVPVRWDTYVRAQSDTMFKSYVGQGAFGKFAHIRQPTPLEQQNVIRMNRDTLYSEGVFDLTNPLTIIKPGTGDEIQDQIVVQQSSPGTFEIPNWDQQDLKRLTDAINVLAATMTDFSKCFGTADEVDPVKYLLGAAAGWGGLPETAATYEFVTPEKNDGHTPHVLTVKDVPVDEFWSVSLYNKYGYFEENPSGVYVINDRNAAANEDGSVTIHFGGVPDQPNHLYIMDGWNYTVRLYRPRQEILDGTWTVPPPQPVE